MINFLSVNSDEVGNEQNDVDWKRPAGTPCRLPNVIHDRSTTVDNASSSREFGGFCCSFSPCGTFLAWTVAQQYEHTIVVERFLGNLIGRKTRVRLPAHSGLIYDVYWSQDSKFLVACSADQTATVWSIPSNIESARPELRATLPAPCYLYSVRINAACDQVYLFGQEGTCLVYSLLDGEEVLSNEIFISDSAINSAAITCDNAKIYCCGANGHLFWTNLIDGRLPDTEIQFESKKLSQSAADCVVAHPKISQKLAVLCRDNSVHYVDMRLGDVMALDGVASAKQLTRCTFSPCGSLLLGSFVSIWKVFLIIF